METSHTDVETRLLERALPPAATVLEAGCGRTTRLGAFRERIAELVGVDVAAAGAQNAALDRFVAADLCAPLPFADASFDLVYSNFVVEHLQRPAAAFAQWRRVLKDDGSLVLLTSNIANPLVRGARHLPRRAVVGLKRAGAGAAEDDVIPTVYRANTPSRLDGLLRCAGFVPVEVHVVATLHRYAGERRWGGAVLDACERALPERRRATIVAWYAVGRRGR